MQKLYEITIPGLSLAADFQAVHHRLLADFPSLVDVLATTTPATVLVVYTCEPEVDCWIDALSDSVATRRTRLRHRHVHEAVTEASAASPHTQRRQIEAVREAMWRLSRVRGSAAIAGHEVPGTATDVAGGRLSQRSWACSTRATRIVWSPPASVSTVRQSSVATASPRIGRPSAAGRDSSPANLSAFMVPNGTRALRVRAEDVDRSRQEPA
jgi:hypothetical protein